MNTAFQADFPMESINDKTYLFLSLTPTNRLTHLRHILTLKFAKTVQEKTGCSIVIHLLDTKAFLRDPSIKWADVHTATSETMKDILSFGYDMTKTHIILNTRASDINYVMLCDLQRKVKLGSFYNAFFKDDSVNVGMMDVIFQNACFAIPAYIKKILPNYSEMRCVMLLRESQRPMFDLAKEVTSLTGAPEPQAIYGVFVKALQGNGKMPKLAQFAIGTSANTGGKVSPVQREYMAVYLKETPKQVLTKINKFALSGGRDSLQEQQELGANLEVDIPIHYIGLFMEDAEEYKRITTFYGPGELPGGNSERLSTGTIKKICAEAITAVLQPVQQKRDLISTGKIGLKLNAAGNPEPTCEAVTSGLIKLNELGQAVQDSLAVTIGAIKLSKDGKIDPKSPALKH